MSLNLVSAAGQPLRQPHVTEAPSVHPGSWWIGHRSRASFNAALNEHRDRMAREGNRWANLGTTENFTPLWQGGKRASWESDHGNALLTV